MPPGDRNTVQHCLGGAAVAVPSWSRLAEMRSGFAHGAHLYRAVLCGHKAVEAGAVCLLLMVQGDLGAVTLSHLAIAAKTGALAVSPAIALTFTRYAYHLTNRWTVSALLGICTFATDAILHASHYPGAWTEAAFTGAGAFTLSIAVSYTRLGKRIDRLAERFFITGSHGAMVVPVHATRPPS